MNGHFLDLGWLVFVCAFQALMTGDGGNKEGGKGQSPRIIGLFSLSSVSVESISGCLFLPFPDLWSLPHVCSLPNPWASASGGLLRWCSDEWFRCPPTTGFSVTSAVISSAQLSVQSPWVVRPSIAVNCSYSHRFVMARWPMLSSVGSLNGVPPGALIFLSFLSLPSP